MTHTPTIRNALVLAVFFLIQFFWFTVAFTYSESRTADRSEERLERTSAVPEIASVPDVPGIVRAPDHAGDVAASLPESTHQRSAFAITQSTFALAGPGATQTSTSSVFGDLGAQIKYCIVFPLLEDAGPPIPDFDVPPCPLGPPLTEDAELTVVKVVINDDDGTATTTDFVLFVHSTRISSGATIRLSPGSYVVSEATTTITVGTTTINYTQEFDGDCDAQGSVTLASGESKICTIINDDAGPGGQGGEGNGGGDGDGGGGDGDGGDGDGNGGGRGGRGGRVLGQTTPEFMGGADGVPGVPNTGDGGNAEGALGLLVFSFTPTFLGLAYLSTGFLRRRLRL